MTRSSNQLHARHAGQRWVLLRLFAVLLAVLALGAQGEHVLRSARLAPVSAGVSHAVERAGRLETNAIRVAASVRVAPAPRLARLPIVFTSVASSRAPGARLYFASTVRQRAPRMNSEEPPRG